MTYRRSNETKKPSTLAFSLSDQNPSLIQLDEDADGPKPNLYRTILKTFWIYWAEATSFMGVAEVSWLLQPVILR